MEAVDASDTTNVTGRHTGEGVRCRRTPLALVRGMYVWACVREQLDDGRCFDFDLLQPVWCMRRHGHAVKVGDTHGHLGGGHETVGKEGNGGDGRDEVVVVRGQADGSGTHR